MTYSVTGKRTTRPAASAALRYGLAFASIAAALGLARIFLYFHLPQPFAAFALSAIAITFWYGGVKPGIVATVFASLLRYSHWSERGVASSALYDLVFVIFALLMIALTRARSELEVSVEQRTTELTRANEELSLEIAERKRAEEKLRRSEAYLAEAQRLSRTGSWARVPATGELRYCSEECYRVLGFDPRDGQPRFETFMQRVHPDDQASVREISAAASRDKVDYETDYRIIHPDGEIRDIHVVAHPVFDPSGDLVEFVGTVMDVTERKRAEEKLRQSEAYLAEAQKLTHTGSWVWDVAERRALHLSEEWYSIYGFDPQEGMSAWKQRLQRIHPDDRVRCQQIIDQAIGDKSEYEVEYRILLPRGTVRHLQSVGHPILNASGNLVQFVGSSTDVTERRQAEEALRQAQADLARISRITTMGELTASLAHEVNQPIAAAVTDANTCLRWLNRDHPDLEEAREAASRVVKDATRAAEIISRTRLLFKKATPQGELVDMHEIVREMVVLMSGEAARYSISVWAELAAELSQVMGDRVQLQQVLMNLMMNSIEAMKDVDGPRELIIRSRTEDGQVMVSVSDTGVGLPPQQADQIFNAFFTTKAHGTGMGLRISRSIVESHGGRLWAEGNSPRGANFHFTLPTKVDLHE
ncbi:MAG: PAS domain-containing protein [Terriglobales bacterium]